MSGGKRRRRRLSQAAPLRLFFASLTRNITVRSNNERQSHKLDYVVQLTRDATRLAPQDRDKLRAVGFGYLAILQITLIAPWFNYINRVADALPRRAREEGRLVPDD
jgi:alkylhydroperoxidase family enzyme